MDSKAKFALLKSGARRKRKPARARYYPISRKVEIAYTKELLSISKLLKAEGDEVLRIVKENRAYIGDSSIIKAQISDAPFVINRIKDFLFGGITRRIDSIANALSTNVVTAQAKATDTKLAQKIKDISNIDAISLIEAGDLTYMKEIAIAKNVMLIKSIPAQYHIKIENLVLDSLAKDKGVDWLAGEINKLGQSTDARARLIARDQTGSINAAVNKSRCEDLGVEEYIWTTQGDDRVRSYHKSLNKTKQRWDAPTSDGHPGDAIDCRCDSVPVI